VASPLDSADGAAAATHAPRSAPQLQLGGWNEIGAAARAVRTQVFVIEQRIAAAEEWDEWDAPALHAVARDIAGGAIGTGRLLPAQFDADRRIGHIGRMAVLREARGAGVGGIILRALMQAAPGYGFEQIVLHAQSHVAGFYARHGFAAEGVEFLEVDIPHVLMRARLR
jgi:predicted GNAT family N-acyltransferase